MFSKKMRQPFSYENVQPIVTNTMRSFGPEDLKERVTEQVKKVTGITGWLPERIRTWIHQLCMHAIQEKPIPHFSGKLAQPIDLDSLPTSQRPRK